MKRKLFFIAVIVICLSLTAYGTLAYFNAEDTAHNVITTGNVDIELQEWADEEKKIPFPDEAIAGVMPNTSVIKIVEVKNTGLGDAWVRVQVQKSYIPKDGEESKDTEFFTLDYNTNDWAQGSDGYYYYKTPLKPGETTEPLFTKVSFAATMGNEYQNATAKVTVAAQAVQFANNGTTYAQAKGWPTT